MFVKEIQELKDQEFVGARLLLEPAGTLTVRVRRSSGAIWILRKREGEASIAFVSQPGCQHFSRDELGSLAQQLSRKPFLGVGASGQLLFEGGVEVHPIAHLAPKDLSDNSRNVIRYECDVPVPGVRPRASPPEN
jgi:hypothetical protein